MKFENLSVKQQSKAMDAHRYINLVEGVWDEQERYAFIQKMKEYGFDDVNLLVDTSCTQGSGASFDTDNVDIEKFLRKTKQWSKYRILHEMIRIKDIDCVINRKSFPHYVHSNMVHAYINIDFLDLTTKQENAVEELETTITNFVRSESDSIHSELESLMLDLIKDEEVKETIIANDMEFEECEDSITYI